MAELLKGAPVAAAINDKTRSIVAALGKIDVVPTLAILRVGQRVDDLSYERGAMKRCEELGVAVRQVILTENASEEEVLSAIDQLNKDTSVHGVLIFRPMPKHIRDEAVRSALAPEKDVDGITDGSLAGVFTGSGRGFAPCTAQAVVEILEHYGVELSGKSAVVVGRSLVVGRPAAMLLMAKNATVTICHTRTKDLPAVTRRAEIIVAAAGQMRALGGEHFAEGQTVVDVGIHWNEKIGKLCGDVRFEEAESLVAAITPVPGGVGAVTTALLIRHVAEAAAKQMA